MSCVGCRDWEVVYSSNWSVWTSQVCWILWDCPWWCHHKDHWSCSSWQAQTFRDEQCHCEHEVYGWQARRCAGSLWEWLPFPSRNMVHQWCRDSGLSCWGQKICWSSDIGGDPNSAHSTLWSGSGCGDLLSCVEGQVRCDHWPGRVLQPTQTTQLEGSGTSDTTCKQAFLLFPYKETSSQQETVFQEVDMCHNKVALTNNALVKFP